MQRYQVAGLMNEEKPRKNWITRMSVIIAAAIIFLVTLTALQVDNWSRDLTNNYAKTEFDTQNELLRPVESELNLNEAEDVVRRAAQNLSGWEFVDTEWSEDGDGKLLNEPMTIRLTRTSPIFQFVDDVTVTLNPIEAGTRIDIESESRVGKGDLGQNPRNIQMLVEQIHVLLGRE